MQCKIASSLVKVNRKSDDSETKNRGTTFLTAREKLMKRQQRKNKQSLLSQVIIKVMKEIYHLRTVVFKQIFALDPRRGNIK